MVYLMNATQTIERIKLTDVELMNLLDRPALKLCSKTHAVIEYAGKFELYAVGADGMETFVGYLARE